MQTPFENDTFSLVWQAFKNLYPDKDCKCYWDVIGEKTEAEYKAWRQGQIMIGKRWEEMRDTLAQDYHNVTATARSL